MYSAPRQLSGASLAAILGVIGKQEERFTEIMVVGHNPGFTELVNQLVPDLELHNLPTAGVVGIESSAARWADVAARNTTMLFYDYPKNPDEAA